MQNLQHSKKIALENYKTSKENYLKNMSNENWIKFCDSKRNCMLLGIRI